MTDLLTEARRALAFEQALFESMGGEPRDGDPNYWLRRDQGARVNAIEWMIVKLEGEAK